MAPFIFLVTQQQLAMVSFLGYKVTWSHIGEGTWYHVICDEFCVHDNYDGRRLVGYTLCDINCDEYSS